MKYIQGIVLLSVLLLASCMNSSEESAIKELHMTSGSVRGVYYPVAHSLARVINEDQRDLGYHISVRSSHGSVANINNILTGNTDFAIVQYDVLLAARHGDGDWKGRGGDQLVAIARLYDEAVTLVVSAQSDWNDLRHITQAHVGIGSEGSGHHHNAQQVLSVMGDLDYVKRDSRVTSSALAAVGGELDAAFLTIGHPAPLLKQVMEREVPPRIVSIPPDVRDVLVAQYPALIESTIAQGSYGSQPAKDVNTVGLPAVLVCRSDLSVEVVRDIVRHLRNKLPQLHKAHPVLTNLSPAIMASLDPAVYHPAVDLPVAPE